jgi:hypothetical protein
MAEWQQFNRGAKDVEWDGECLRVEVGRGRQQRVHIKATIEAIEFSAVVARRSVVDGLDQPALAAWTRNRAASLVGFRIDNKGRIVGEAWVPRVGLTREEFLFYVRRTAAACDLFEFQLTGRDRE